MSEQPDQPEFPALSNDEIHKSLDDIATLLAGQSNRMDEQTKVLNRLSEVAIAARQAAFAAREQTDPLRSASSGNGNRSSTGSSAACPGSGDDGHAAPRPRQLRVHM